MKHSHLVYSTFNGRGTRKRNNPIPLFLRPLSKTSAMTMTPLYGDEQIRERQIAVHVQQTS